LTSPISSDSTSSPPLTTLTAQERFVQQYHNYQQRYPTQLKNQLIPTYESASLSLLPAELLQTNPPPSSSSSSPNSFLLDNGYNFSPQELKALDDKWMYHLRRNPEDERALIVAHLDMVLSLPSHTIGQKVHTFGQNWFEPYARISGMCSFSA
jgi:hypothetical protein